MHATYSPVSIFPNHTEYHSLHYSSQMEICCLKKKKKKKKTPFLNKNCLGKEKKKKKL